MGYENISKGAGHRAHEEERVLTALLEDQSSVLNLPAPAPTHSHL